MLDVMEQVDLANRIRRALAGRAGIRLALLFGSEARGTARPDSDVDLAVAGTAIDALEIAAYLGAILQREVQVTDLTDATIPLLEALVRDAVVVHEGVHGAAAEWRSKTLATLETDRPWFARMRDAYLRQVAEQGFGRG